MIKLSLSCQQAEIDGLKSNNGIVRPREVEMLKAELRSCRQGALREGARRALARAGREYAASVDAHSAGIRSAFDAVTSHAELIF